MKNNKFLVIFLDYFSNIYQAGKVSYVFFCKYLPKPFILLTFIFALINRLFDRFIEKIFWRH